MLLDLLTPFGVTAIAFNRNQIEILERTREVERPAGLAHVFVSPFASVASNQITGDPALFRLGLLPVLLDGAFPD